MLIRFEVANFRSILDPVELSMVAVDRDRPEARPIENIGESLLPVAALYGPNASGKSNVLAALAWLRTAVADSLRFWDDRIPVEPFAFTDHGRTSEFAVEMIVDGVRFEYVVELDQEVVRYEGLFHFPEKKRRRIFERDGDNLKFQRGLGALSGTRELMTPRTLVLSAARRFEEPLVTNFANELIETRSLGLRPSEPFGITDLYWRTMQADSEARAKVLSMLRLADLGISGVVIDRHAGARRVRLVHQAGTAEVPFDFAAESEGTRTWFQLIGYVLVALENGSLLLFDELDASLHPTLSMQLIRLFHDPETNPKGAQLVFTSHDTSLLNHLNRDEVWLTEKREDGATRLGALAEFAGERVRRSQNLEKAYLHGRFGALPDVDRTELLRALGLIG